MRTSRQDSGCYAKPILPNCAFFNPVELEDDFDKGPKPRLCFFFEDCGRDASRYLGCERWRVVFYYASHLAITKTWPSEEQKNGFLSKLQIEGAK